MRAKLVQKDKEIKKRDHRIFKQLEDHQHAKLLPKALSSLVKDCLTSGREEELERLREQVIRLEGAADAMRTDALIALPSAARTRQCATLASDKTNVSSNDVCPRTSSRRATP